MLCTAFQDFNHKLEQQNQNTLFLYFNYNGIKPQTLWNSILTYTDTGSN